MNNKIKRFFKRLKLRFYLWSIKDGMFKTHEDEVTTYEKTCFQICLKVIKHPLTNFDIAPKSEKRYLENNEMDLFITMDSGSVYLTNHIYHYNVKLTKRDWERLIYIFDEEAEHRRLKYENNINSQIKNSLSVVLDRISKL